MSIVDRLPELAQRVEAERAFFDKHQEVERLANIELHDRNKQRLIKMAESSPVNGDLQDLKTHLDKVNPTTAILNGSVEYENESTITPHYLWSLIWFPDAEYNHTIRAFLMLDSSLIVAGEYRKRLSPPYTAKEITDAIGMAFLMPLSLRVRVIERGKK